ncbi:hydroxymethylglutaryl-CoA lyase [Salinicola acroporae]|uniref:hydroxymethylglutaryl-CoA lyase n=1 Tax=Salinicola acroporae TaxID=1541440 RepID=UPI0031BBAE7F
MRLVEVAARDGLQNEPEVLPVAMRVELLERLADTGLRHLEAGAFVSPRWVPQMQQTQDVLSQLNRRPNISYSVLVPNSKGFEFARAAGVDEIAVFTAASEAFAHHNINCSIAESLARFEPIMPLAAQAGIRVRGYISCVLGCPYTGDVDPQKVSTLARHLLDMGCYEVSLGDTTGIGTPRHTRELIEACARQLPVGALAGHFHDTWGMAVANVQAALEAGIRVFDGSVSALGAVPTHRVPRVTWRPNPWYACSRVRGSIPASIWSGWSMLPNGSTARCHGACLRPWPGPSAPIVVEAIILATSKRGGWQ